jgi:putative oxidoreductase
MEQSIELKTNSIKSTWISLIRIVLGILLIWKGLLFTQDTSELQVAIQRTGVGEYAGFLDIIAAAVSIFTFVSGMFIMVGFLTRIVSFIQIAIIILGIAFIYSTGIQRNSFELISTIIILSLLALVANKGSGSISFDKAIEQTRMHE